MRRTKLNLYEYFKKYGLKKLLKYHAFINGEHFKITPRQYENVKYLVKKFKLFSYMYADACSIQYMHQRLRTALGVKIHQELEFDLN